MQTAGPPFCKPLMEIKKVAETARQYAAHSK